MRIEPAWTREMQALTNNSDVIAVVEAALIPGALGTIAIVLRDQVGQQSADLDRALDGALLVLTSLVGQEAQLPPDEAFAAAGEAVWALRSLYGNATSSNDLEHKRGKVLDLLVHRMIGPEYAEDECHMDCRVTGPGDHYRWLAGHEFDICAWAEDDGYGEAYECAVQPHRLQSTDYSALVTLRKAVLEEYGHPDPWFRTGMVTFQHSRHIARRIAAWQHDDAVVQAYGYNNLTSLRQ